MEADQYTQLLNLINQINQTLFKQEELIPNLKLSASECRLLLKKHNYQEEYVLEILKQKPELDLEFLEIPKEKFTEKIADCLVNGPMHGNTFDCIPLSFRTYDRCFKAVSINGKNIRYVPSSILNEQLILTAMEDDPDNIFYVFFKQRTFTTYQYFFKNTSRKIEECTTSFLQDAFDKLMFENQKRFFHHSDVLKVLTGIYQSDESNA